MKIRWIALALAYGSTLFISPVQAQIPSYLGDFFTRGAGDIGTRSGETADFRFFAGISAIYDNGVQPYSLDSSGHLSTVNGLYGAEVALGVYGQHQYKHAKLGLDYKGTFRHYNNTFWDGSDHQLALGYTYQKSQRTTFDLRQTAGTSSLGSSFAGALPNAFDTVVDPTTLLFDNRTYYLQSSADMSYSQSLRNTFTVGGDWSTVQRQSSALIGVNTYGLHGTFERRLSQANTFGITYNHTHYDFSQGFGESDIDTVQAFFTRTFGRDWKASLHGGIYHSEVVGVQQFALDPVLAVLLGTPSVTGVFYRTNWLPSVDAILTRTFKRSFITASYSRSVTPGNGVYLASREELGGVNYAYTGFRKWTFNVLANYARLSALGPGLPPYTQYSGGTGFTYALTRALYVNGHYDLRHYDIAADEFQRTASRITLGLSFSPAEIPLSFR